MSSFSIGNLQRGLKRHTAKADNKAEYDVSHFCFIPTYQWLNSIHLRRYRYTNLLKGKKQFFTDIKKLLFVILPKIYTNSYQIFHAKNSHNRHCHVVSRKANPKVFDLLLNIFKSLHGITDKDIFGDNEPGYTIWEVGYTEGARIFGIYDSNYNNFYPLLCDWHHLVYKDVKHNQHDYKNYSYDPKILLHIIGSTLRMYL